MKYKLKWPENIFTCQIIEEMSYSVFSRACVGKKNTAIHAGEVTICYTLSEWRFGIRNLFWGIMRGINKDLQVNEFITKLFVT